MQYSGFRKDNNLSFSLTMFLFLATGLFGFMAKWVWFDANVRKNKYFGVKKHPVAGQFFDAWDWDINNHYDRVDSTKGLWRDLNFIIHE